MVECVCVGGESCRDKVPRVGCPQKEKGQAGLCSGREGTASDPSVFSVKWEPRLRREEAGKEII